ncbi:Ig-like domain-containing protein [Kineobactrum salinum]|uniref:Big-1 domain-containing protein n=1 Tax=Kineobactrum salinum TaxID=2708301 RepID=A0A6C0U9L9_9GAMM|nr:hypothetical protein [Kineobactrum salinum]QIB66374.1 hypothetical protein G3T16_14195 [Kineobactrum salinum]
MTNRFATLTSRLAAVLALVLTLFACGGGGGGGGSGFLPGDDDTYFLDLVMVDPVGNPTDTISSTTPATLYVTVTRNGRNGAPVSGQVVSAQSELALITPDSGTALTDDDGVATLQVESDGTLGAGSIEVSVDAPDGTVTQSINFQAIRAALRLGHFRDGEFINGELGTSADSIPRAGTAAITVSAVDEDDNPVDTAEEVRFSSGCERSGTASFSENPLTLENGRGTIEYTAANCNGEDEITATLVGTSTTASATIFVAPAQVTSIIFESAEPPVLALKGTGGGSGLQETGFVTFRVVDADNTPLSGVEVDFELTTDIGGITLAQSRGVSNAEGLVTTVVQSGNVATAVRVTATIEANAPDGSLLTLTTVSDVLAITTGLPDQNSISLSAESLNVPGARQLDGVQIELTVRMADKFNNPVPDGTAAVFRTEYGSIEGSCATGAEGEAGACTVIWTSQAPRFPTFNADLVRTTNDSEYNCPSHSEPSGPCPDDLGYIRGMRSTVLVTALGEESFIDQNGNGLYDEGEPFDDLAEAFIDHNEDGRYNPARGCVPSSALCEAAGSEETFVDFNNDGVFNLGNGIYNGVLCPPEGDGVFCSRKLVNVRDNIVLILGSETGFDILLIDNGTLREPTVLRTGRIYRGYIADQYNNAPDGEFSVRVEGDSGCEIEGDDIDIEIADSNSRGAYRLPQFRITENNGGIVRITLSGRNTEVIATYPCQEPPPED